MTATIGGQEKVEEELVYLRLHPADLDSEDPIIDLKPLLPSSTWQVVKRFLRKHVPALGPVRDQNIRLLHKSVELPNGKMIDDYIMESGTPEHPISLAYLIIDRGEDGQEVTKEQKHSEFGMYIDSNVPATPDVEALVREVLAAWKAGRSRPTLTDDGTGATYILKDGRKNLGAFKPKDEEAFAPQNPRGYVGRENTPCLRKGVLSTQQASREVAAFLLDHEQSARVPATALVHAKHPSFVKVKTSSGDKLVWKIGSFQSWVSSKECAGDRGTGSFQVRDVHRIGILDIRIINMDRNEGNLLVREPSRSSPIIDLIPIDHGLSLPDCLFVNVDDLIWMGWPQARKRFRRQEREYIRNLSGDADAKMLADKLGIRRDCLLLLKVTTKLLQIGAAHGLTLFEIGKIMYREPCYEDNEEEKPSKLEDIIERSVDAALCVARLGGDKTVVSATLAGLDLITHRPVDNSFARHNHHGGLANTPLVSQPDVVAAAPMSSPMLQAANPDDPDAGGNFSLDDGTVTPMPLEFGPSAGQAKLNTSNINKLESAFDPLPRPRKQTPRLRIGSLRRGSASKFRQPQGGSKKDEGGNADTDTSIFSRPGVRVADWPPEVEDRFMHFVATEIKAYVEKHFEKRPEPTESDEEAS